MKKKFDIYAYLQTRPLSWSAISSFQYDREQWYRRYILGEKSIENPEMKFGKVVGERIASGPTYLPFVPCLNTFEHPFNVMFGKIKMTGFGDSFCTITNKKGKEYKTGVKVWDQDRADEHGQITLYSLMHFITTKIRPEEVEWDLVWLPTKREETGDFKVNISFVDPIEKTFKVFKTKRTMKDILLFGAVIKEVVKQMEDYVNKKLSTDVICIKEDYKIKSR